MPPSGREADERERAAPFRSRTAFHVRPADPRDEAALSRLCGDLGYAAPEAAIGPRLRGLVASAGDAVLVAEGHAGDVAGFVHAAVRLSLTDEPLAEILALVVAPEARGRGAGSDLLAAAEAWSRGRGCLSVRVRTRVEREGAHRFYARAGYRLAKTQRVFVKELAGGAAP